MFQNLWDFASLNVNVRMGRPFREGVIDAVG